MRHESIIIACFLCFLSPSIESSLDTVSKTLFERYEKIQHIACDSETKMDYDEVVIISSQSEFDCLQEIIVAKQSSGISSLKIILQPGHYYYKQAHLSFESFAAPDFSVTLSGEKAILIAKGDDFLLRKPLFSKMHETDYNGAFPFDLVLLDDSLDEVSFSSSIKNTDRPLEIIDKSEQICRIHVGVSQNIEDCKYIIVTTWFTSIHGPVVKVDDDWIYFRSSDIEYNELYRCYNINYDYGYGKMYPRYILFNKTDNERAYLKNGKLFLSSESQRVHQCKESCFLKLDKTRMAGLRLENLMFVGSARGEESLLCVSSSNVDSVVICNCAFRAHKNQVITVTDTNNISVSGCTFQDCYSTCIFSDNGCKNTQITNCMFNNNGRDLLQDNCVWCLGEDFYIANNIFKNFSYAAVRTGILPWDSKLGLTSGIIEYNELFYEQDYFDSFAEHTLMDSGAIYVSTKNDNTIIRYNYIHDYVGLKNNRGIFCDTGTQNTHIYGNIILNIPNSFTIELWRVASSERWVPDANDGNSIFLNILDGQYRFDGKKGARSNSQGKNYLLYYGNRPRIQQRDLTVIEADELISCGRAVTLETILEQRSICSSAVFPHLNMFLEQ